LQAAEKYIKHCFTLAVKGLGMVSPNPLVGCVIVKDDNIASEGYHQQYGGVHAEVNAIQSLPSYINPGDCTLYVNLEPCSHHGKTPPCADLIIKKGFKKVVICNTDPNPLVAGLGIKKLKQAGIDVISGVLESEGRELNKAFFIFHEKKRPFIILKWAQSTDGFIAAAGGKMHVISSPEALRFSHSIRARVDAIVVGKNTVLNDNPRLSTRLVEGKNPIRIILGNIPEHKSNLLVFNSESTTIIINSLKNKKKDTINWVKNECDNHIHFLVNYLYQNQVGSLLVEGGTTTIDYFLEEGLWDEIHVFINPDLTLKDGVKAPNIKLNVDYQLLNGTKHYIIHQQES